tara:strand:- start:358 stop:936 length:579 start_codon:yes stop_codon:yes gene_type:complete
MGTIFVDNLEPQSGTSLTLGASGDTVQVASGVTNNLGISMADQFRLSATLTGDGSDGFLTSNLERVDSAGQGTLGTGMSESAGVFTFPSTGIYLVRLFCNAQALDGNETAIHMDINVTTNNSTYTSRARNQQGNRSGNHTNVALSTETLVDVTDTSQVKVKIGYGSLNNNNTLVGDTDQNRTFITFIRLGDT